jgi:hypothetical protein
MDNGILPKLAFNTNQKEENKDNPRRWKEQSHYF